MVPEYVERGLKILGITEVEMEGLSLINTEVAIALSLATFFVGMAIPTGITLVISPQKGVTEVVLWLVVAFLIILGIGAALSIKWLSSRRQTIEQRVNRESKRIPRQSVSSTEESLP